MVERPHPCAIGHKRRASGREGGRSVAAARRLQSDRVRRHPPPKGPTMSSHRIPETESARAPRPAPPGVVDFFLEAGTITRDGDAPLLLEWTDWAARYESLDAVWRASRTPELSIFMLGHAVRRDYLEHPQAMLDALELFVGWCVDYAGLDPKAFRAVHGATDEASSAWFALTGASAFGRARLAARAVEEAAVGAGALLPHEILRKRAEQAAMLRLYVGNPFYSPDHLEECGTAEAEIDAECEMAESSDVATDDDGEMEASELVLAPAERGPWGLVTRLVGPPDLAGAYGTVAAALRKADASLRRGMILLTKRTGDDYVASAEECFRDALSMLLGDVGEVHPKMAYACDRIALVCQIRGEEEEAEAMYLRAIAIRDAGAWGHTLWDEVTLLNLATLYADQGKYVLQDAMLERLEKARRRDRQAGHAEFHDPDQLELS